MSRSHVIDLTLSDDEDKVRTGRRFAIVRGNPGRTSSCGPPISMRKKGPTCSACTEDDDLRSRCDGECPCSWCAERGMTCIYPGNVKPVTLNLSLRPQIRPRTPSAVQPSESILGSPARRSTPIRHIKASPSKSHLRSEINLVPLNQWPDHPASNASQIIDEEPFNEESDSDEGPPLALNSIDQVTRRLTLHEARLRAHQEYLVRPVLSRAKLEAIKASRPEGSEDRRNPFSKLITSSKSGTKSNQKMSSLSLLVKSHKAGAPKKWMTMSVPMIVVRTSPVILPKYKSIGRLGSSLLAPNSGVLKYLPYFADVEEYPDADKKRVQEIEDYYHTDERRMRNQRKCFELAELWRPWVERFISDLGIQLKDVMWHMLDDMAHDKVCKLCKTNLRSMIEVETLNSTRPRTQDSRSIGKARLATAAFENVTGFSIWHIIIGTEFVRKATELTERQKKEVSTLCSICFLHNCVIHGAYVEPEDTSSGAVVFSDGNNQGQSSVKINDDERHLNERLMAVVPNKNTESTHQCGLYCVDTETTIKSLLGRKQGGGADGIYNRAANATRPGLDNNQLCGPACFWQAEKRTRFSKVSQTKSFEPDIDLEAKKLFKSLLRLHCNNQRAPCMIAADLIGLTCMDAFYYMLAETQRRSHVVQTGLNTDHQGTRKISKAAQGLDTSESKDLDQRPPFIPCSHEGLCQNNPDCTCSEDHVHCEQFCGCDQSCKRRYQGCSCAGSNKVCFDDGRCECWALNRECDPWLCGSCGAMEVLDPANKYNDEIRKGRCKNTKIQLELPARTIKAPSEVQGWGLFAGQDLEKNAFIGEYKGERVGNQESDRRGTVYHHLGQEYLFTVNREQQIDGSNFGNKMRFINNSMREEYINVQAKNLLCNGVQRIMLYAKRPIKAGDELLYNYNYPESVYKRFWERGEEPDSGRLTKPAIPLADARLAKKVGRPSDDGSSVSRMSLKQSAARREDVSTTSERLPNQRPIPKTHHDGGSSDMRRETKRKRMSDDDLSPAYATDVKDNQGVQDEEDTSEFEGDIATTSTDEDEHLLEDEAESSSPEAESAILGRVDPTEKRVSRGNLAHKSVWDINTRKKKTM